MLFYRERCPESRTLILPRGRSGGITHPLAGRRKHATRIRDPGGNRSGEIRMVSDPDDRAAFTQRMRAQSEALGRDRRVFAAALDALHAADKYDYTYLWSWMGVPIIQLPADIIATQEVIWATHPDVIVETGVARGGSVLFMASMLELIGKGKVIGVDIDMRSHNRDSIERHCM